MVVQEAWLSGIPVRSWGKNGGSFTGGPPKIVLHTTETYTVPSYNSGNTAPHLTAYPDLTSMRLEWQQHSPLDKAARALRNESGGVQTNRDSVYQIELVGTCNPSYEYRSRCIFWPDAPPWALYQLGEMVKRLAANGGVRLVSPGLWYPYPKSYGKSDVRLSLSQWDAFSGVCGHQHVPENSHGDPGDIDINKILGTSVVLATRIPVIRPTVPARPQTAADFPEFPLGYCQKHGVIKVFGPRSGPDHHLSGYYSSRDRNHLRVWQTRMKKRGWKISVDGLFGPETQKVTKQFQRDKKLTVDGLIGPNTWRAAWNAPVTA